MGFLLLIAFVYMLFRTFNELTSPDKDKDE
jgi:hypothetical protein